MASLTYITCLGQKVHSILNVYNEFLHVLAEVCGEDRYMPRVNCLSVPVRTKHCPFHDGFSVINLPPVSWMTYPENGPILGAWGWVGNGCWKTELSNGGSLSSEQVEVDVAEPMHNL